MGSRAEGLYEVWFCGGDTGVGEWRREAGSTLILQDNISCVLVHEVGKLGMPLRWRHSEWVSGERKMVCMDS